MQASNIPSCCQRPPLPHVRAYQSRMREWYTPCVPSAASELTLPPQTTTTSHLVSGTSRHNLLHQWKVHRRDRFIDPRLSELYALWSPRPILTPQQSPRYIAELDFPATCFAAAPAGSNPTSIIFAAGGYSSDLHLSLHSFPPAAQARSASPKLIWRHSTRLRGQSEIVNSILFSPTPLTDDTRRSSSDLRIAVCGNDSSVKFYDIRMQPSLRDEKREHECGMVKLNTPINHGEKSFIFFTARALLLSRLTRKPPLIVPFLSVSISPDGRTLLCVGDTPEAYLFDISPGPKVTFSPLATYALPPPPPSALRSSPTHPPPPFRSLACFTTAWSADGLKFAVASQEGQLCVWDVRSARPLFTFWTTWRRNSTGRHRLGEWEWEDLGGPIRTDDTTNNGPDSGIRNVKFSAGEGGRELMVFTEVSCGSSYGAHDAQVHV